MQPAGFIDQLLDVHRNAHALGDAADLGAGPGRLGNARGLAWLRINFAKNNPDRWLDRAAVHDAPHFPGIVTLRRPRKSSSYRAILWLLSRDRDHKVLQRQASTGWAGARP